MDGEQVASLAVCDRGAWSNEIVQGLAIHAHAQPVVYPGLGLWRLGMVRAFVNSSDLLPVD
jgi:hypothetical protein